MGQDKTVYVTRSCKATARLPREEAMLWDKRLANAVNFVGGKSKYDSEAYHIIMQRGVLSVEKEQEENGTPSEEAILAKALELIKSKNDRKKILADIYEEKGLEEFTKWGEDHGIDTVEFLQEYDMLKLTAPNVTDRCVSFLDQTLRDCDEMRTSEIHELALKQEIVKSESDWNVMRVVASRGGYSHRHGYWKHPL